MHAALLAAMAVVGAAPILSPSAVPLTPDLVPTTRPHMVPQLLHPLGGYREFPVASAAVADSELTGEQKDLVDTLSSHPLPHDQSLWGMAPLTLPVPTSIVAPDGVDLDATLDDARLVLGAGQDHVGPIWRCHICGRVCTRKSNLAVHMRIHSGERVRRISLLSLFSYGRLIYRD